MIRPCTDQDFDAIYEIVNDGAQAYKGAIPADRWHEPYMPMDELRSEVACGVKFWGFEENGALCGVMGIQPVQDVTLVRHAYVRTANQGGGVGRRLLEHLLAKVATPVLIGAWADATWAVRFYEKNGFQQVTREEKARLLRQYWSIPERQVETSVVLADKTWRQMN